MLRQNSFVADTFRVRVICCTPDDAADATAGGQAGMTAAPQQAALAAGPPDSGMEATITAKSAQPAKPPGAEAARSSLFSDAPLDEVSTVAAIVLPRAPRTCV